MIAITGASGQLGRLVIKALLETVPAGELVAAVRSPEKVADLAALGVEVRHADYDSPESLKTAFAGVEKLLLISSSEVGKRTPQHKAVIEAASQNGVKMLAYTSILHCDTSPLMLAAEHKETEAALRDSGLPHVLLRNGWYTENYTAGIPAALENGAILGCAGRGRLASASRADYAAAAAAVLTATEGQAGRTYELAGDDAWSLTDLAAELSKQCGKEIAYRDMPESDYCVAMIGIGLPEPFAAALADAERGIANGALFDDSHQLSRLIGHPTVVLAESIAGALTAE